MRFVNVLERFRIGNVELGTESLEVFGELGVVENLGEGFVLGFDVDLLTSENVGELSFHIPVALCQFWRDERE